ncbi:lipid A deacylase LpxR family protein [Siphonobacter curvatus]|uniref:DUF2219 domain-containing protein n=1 Tax=Siphonobacter curvatus TaxID=2094562 RepID=A0A2S7ILI2_9BACT|nr:lipid A deacylase LpxR family protein [Siphonobacter curvatus]PQA58499.1 hypothetical protein C5O19_02165 [Siphonobacter curvatus]
MSFTLFRYTICLFLLSRLALAQTYSQEIQITSENDAYRWTLHDGYYTNGFFVSYRYVPRRWNERRDSTSRLQKVISTYQLGQQIFNPENVFLAQRNQIDRPYTGYLYASKGFTFFYRQNHVLQLDLALGTIGPRSGAENIQKFIHRTFDYIPPVGWRNQLNNEWGLNLNAQYAYNLIPAPKKWLDLYALGQAQLGTTFTRASVGLLLQIGLFRPASESALFHSRISRNPSSSSPELYLFFQPGYQYQVYNATVQGGLFRSNKGPGAGEITRGVYQHQIGLTYASRRFTLQATLDLKQKEARSMQNEVEKYGGFSAAYRFR